MEELTNLRTETGKMFDAGKAAKYSVTWTEITTVFPYYYNNMRP